MICKLVAFTKDVTEEELKTVKEWLKFLERDDGRLFNVPTHRVEYHIEENTAVITFDRLIRISAEKHIEKERIKTAQIIPLPHPKKLVKKKENIKYRQGAFKKLQELKDLLSTDIPKPIEPVVKESDLPDLDAKQLLMLQKIIEETDEKKCYQTTKSGKLIEISEKPLEESKADIHITFTEIYAIRTIMDVLGTSEVKVIHVDKEHQ